MSLYPKLLDNRGAFEIIVSWCHSYRTAILNLKEVHFLQAMINSKNVLEVLLYSYVFVLPNIRLVM